MKELNLEAGQKVWTIQLGDCVVIDTNVNNDFPIMCKSLSNDNTSFYTIDGKFSYDSEDFYPSLFESNPFERFVDTNETIELSHEENKADLINALFKVCAESEDLGLRVVSKDKLFQLLKSL